MEFIYGAWDLLSSNFMISVYGSFCASFVFIFSLLFIMRPSIKVSPFIVKSDYDYDPNEELFYMFKVVNTTWFPIFDIELSLFKVTPYPAENGKTNNRVVKLDFKIDRLKHIPRAPIFGHGNGTCACLFRTYEDVLSILCREGDKVRIEITAKHGVTGIPRVFQEEFVHRKCIKDGPFNFGKDIGVT